MKSDSSWEERDKKEKDNISFRDIIDTSRATRATILGSRRTTSLILRGLSLRRSPVPRPLILVTPVRVSSASLEVLVIPFRV